MIHVSELKFGKNAAKLDIRRPAKSRLSRSPAGGGDLFIRIFCKNFPAFTFSAKTFHFFCTNFSPFLPQLEIGLYYLLILIQV